MVITDLSRRSHSVEELAAKVLRADQLRKALNRKANFISEDQIRTARNLHKVISTYRSSGRLDVLSMLKKVGLSGDGGTDSTKRLDTYTLPEDASENRKCRLRKTPAKYFEIAAAIAAEVGEPEAVLLSRVFEGCSYGTDYVPDADWDAENWSRLAELTRLMADSVIRKHGLEEYWRKVEATNGMYDVQQNIVRDGLGSLGVTGILPSYGLAGAGIYFEEIPAVPSVELGRKRASAPIDGSIHVKEGEIIDVKFTFWVELRLALGPVNEVSSIGPLLEFRTVLDAAERTAEQSILLGYYSDKRFTFDNPHTDTTDFVSTATFGSEVIPIESLSLEDYDRVPYPKFRDGSEHSYFSWKELNPALLRHLLAPSEEGRAESFFAKRRADGFLGDHPENRFPRNSAAGILHTDLLTGELEKELGEVCDDLAEKVDAHRATKTKQVIEAEADAIARWAKPQAKPSENSESNT